MSTVESVELETSEAESAAMPSSVSSFRPLPPKPKYSPRQPDYPPPGYVSPKVRSPTGPSPVQSAASTPRAGFEKADFDMLRTLMANLKELDQKLGKVSDEEADVVDVDADATPRGSCRSKL